MANKPVQTNKHNTDQAYILTAGAQADKVVSPIYMGGEYSPVRGKEKLKKRER